MGKLVRDKIPDIIRASGRTVGVRRLDEPTFRMALHDKLLQEAAELCDTRPGHNHTTTIPNPPLPLTPVSRSMPTYHLG